MQEAQAHRSSVTVEIPVNSEIWATQRPAELTNNYQLLNGMLRDSRPESKFLTPDGRIAESLRFMSTTKQIKATKR